MVNLSKVVGFEWDKWNIDKSYRKHGITPREAEEIFLDEDINFAEDVEHSQKEVRYSALGKTSESKLLFIVFTIRGNKIRIISARQANRKERRFYEKV